MHVNYRKHRMYPSKIGTLNCPGQIYYNLPLVIEKRKRKNIIEQILILMIILHELVR